MKNSFKIYFLFLFMEGGCCPVFTVSLSYQPALNRRQLCQISVLEGFSGEPVKIHHSHTKQAISCHTDFFPLTPSSSNQLIDIELKNHLIYFKCAFFSAFCYFFDNSGIKAVWWTKQKLLFRHFKHRDFTDHFFSFKSGTTHHSSKVSENN